VDFKRVFGLVILGLSFDSIKQSELDNVLEGKVELIIRGVSNIVIKIVLNSY
jgi:hypothetical protein